VSTETALAGRVALVTGAASGIGRATALLLAGHGAAIGCLDRNEAGAAEVAATIRASGGRAIDLPADVTSNAQVQAAIQRLEAELGPADIVVNNAGIAGSGKFMDVSIPDWQRVVDSHVLGTFLVTRSVLPGMLERGWGRVVVIASEALWLGNTSVQYATAKAGLLGFTRALARQVAPQGVNVNAVAPGPVETPMFLDNTPAEVELERQSVLIGRVLQPEEIAATIAFLCGPGGDAYVGQVLSPNGGTVFPG
jgi:3-oxoacyl-[acyl-carrier protein] reductase